MAEEKVLYRFVGPGTGVTGLPHEVTAEQAQAWEAECVAKEAELAKKRKKVKPESVQQNVEQVDRNTIARMPWAKLQGALARGLYEEVEPEDENTGATEEEKEGDKKS